MTRNIAVGIDLGSSMARVVVGEFIKGEKNPKIIGLGEGEAKGLRKGYIVDKNLAAVSIQNAVRQAEKASGIKLKRAFVSLGGLGLRGDISGGTAIISKADSEVTDLDINKALQDCEDNFNLNNRKLIHVFPLSFKLDGKDVYGRLQGMHGTKLEIKAILITISMQHFEDLVEAAALAGVETADTVAGPMALAQIALSEKQKIAGVGLVNIGSETTTLAVFENGLPISIRVFPIGSTDITNDIALGLKIPLKMAEHLKRGSIEENFSKKKLDEIIEARLSDIFELIENHLKKIKRSELLPAGIVFTGGGASIPGIEELSKSILKLPSSLATTEIFGNSKTKLRDSAWFTALGLLASGASLGSYSDGSLLGFFQDLKRTLKSSLRQLMP